MTPRRVEMPGVQHALHHGPLIKAPVTARRSSSASLCEPSRARSAPSPQGNGRTAVPSNRAARSPPLLDNRRRGA